MCVAQVIVLCRGVLNRGDLRECCMGGVAPGGRGVAQGDVERNVLHRGVCCTWGVGFTWGSVAQRGVEWKRCYPKQQVNFIDKYINK